MDLTAYVNRLLEGVRTWFGLPHAAAALIEADREALGLDRYEPHRRRPASVSEA
jgi:hypothetical protein